MNNSLRELAEIHYGASPNGFRSDDSPFPIFGSSGHLGWANTPLFEGPLVVVARKGTLGNPSYSSSACWVIDTAYAVIPKSEVNAKWLYYNLLNFNLESLNEATGVPSISRDYLYCVTFETPSPHKQRKIAKILTTLDNLIEKTESLIAKYQAIKQGMMHDLFTRGVDENGQLRPPQSEAPHLYKQSPLGWIPSEWSFSTLGSVSERVIVGLALSVTGSYREKGVPLIRNQNIRRGFFEDDDMLHLDPDFAALFPSKKLMSGDVLTVRTGANVGDTARLPEKYVGCLTFTTLITTPMKRELFSPYLVNYLDSALGLFELNRLLVGGGKENLNVGEFVQLRIPLPGVGEQETCVAGMASVTSKLESERTLLFKMKATRIGLIQDLLTGKVPVTPDEAEEVVS